MTAYRRYASLDVKPPPEPEPAKLMIRNTDGFPGVVISVPDAEDLYLLLKEYFEGDGDAEDEDYGRAG